MREGGGNYVKYLISGWNRKERRGNKKFKKGSNLDQVVGALKRGGGGLEPPYKQWLLQFAETYVLLETDFMLNFNLTLIGYI